MSPTLRSTASPASVEVRARVRPGRWRRAGIAVAGLLACALPTMFTVNITRMLLVGELSEHRFHQLTGQGLLLFALWLGGLVPLLRAGWSGARPSATAGLLHVVFVVTGCVCSLAAPGGGAPFLTGVIAVTGALVWLAIPVRPRLRLEVRPHPLLTPVALAAAAVATPYVLDQVALQNAATGHHAQNPHFFDMAWLVSTLVVLGVAAAVLPAARVLAVLAGAGLAWTGSIGLVLDADRGAMGAAVAVGVILAVSAGLLAERRETPTAGRSLL
ncbi:hypothetical protein [Nocardioides sp.]|uniref:hypothetical protein n=1 Tax=Nocardioides sp. TaxID=35761 RepID=UPI0025DFD835|nr:hypothetical protein [Nocardioides sp.]